LHKLDEILFDNGLMLDHSVSLIRVVANTGLAAVGVTAFIKKRKATLITQLNSTSCYIMKKTINFNATDHKELFPIIAPAHLGLPGIVINPKYQCDNESTQMVK